MPSSRKETGKVESRATRAFHVIEKGVRTGGLWGVGLGGVWGGGGWGRGLWGGVCCGGLGGFFGSFVFFFFVVFFGVFGVGLGLGRLGCAKRRFHEFSEPLRKNNPSFEGGRTCGSAA